jgi:hypothetical protein
MPTTPVYALRYPAATDPADVPTDMGELATDVETALSTKAPGAELAYNTVTADASGAVSASGAVIFTFGAATYTAVKHYLEVNIPILRANGVNSIFFELWEGGVKVAGTPTIQIDCPVVNQGTVIALRIPFTPTVASHTYQVAWLGNGTTVFTIKVTGLAPAVARIVRP